MKYYVILSILIITKVFNGLSLNVAAHCNNIVLVGVWSKSPKKCWNSYAKSGGIIIRYIRHMITIVWLATTPIRVCVINRSVV